MTINIEMEKTWYIYTMAVEIAVKMGELDLNVPHG